VCCSAKRHQALQRCERRPRWYFCSVRSGFGTTAITTTETSIAKDSFDPKAFALGVLPVMLMFVGGLKAIQSVVLVVSLPVLVIGVAMTVSLFKSLRHREVVDHV
jgi:hypothetical protein